MAHDQEEEVENSGNCKMFLIKRKKLKTVGTEDASARDDPSRAAAKVLLLRGDSQELSEVSLPSLETLSVT